MNKAIFLGALLGAALLQHNPALAGRKNKRAKDSASAAQSPAKPAGPRSIDPANIDSAIRPGDNFYLYANGNWLKNNPVPASKTSWGSMDVIRLSNLERLRTLCEEAARDNGKNSINQRVGDLYTSAMDTSTIETLGYKPIQAELVRLGSIGTREDVLTEIALQRTVGNGNPLFNFGVGPDDKNVNANIVQLGQGGTSLPDRDYYLKGDARSEAIRKAYVSYVNDLFRLTDDDSVTAAGKAAAVLRIETRLAAAQMTRTDMRDPKKTYHKFSVAAFAKTTPHLPWAKLLPLMQVGKVDSILVNNPVFFKTADSVYAGTPVADLKAYLQWFLLRSKAGYLSSAFVARNFEFTRVITGQKQMTPRWQTMTSMVDNNLGELLGQLYVQRYFTEDAKRRMLEMVQNIRTTFGERIRGLAWMNPETRDRALEKLDAIVNKIGFPDHWKTYDGVVISPKELVSNLNSINTWEYRDMVTRMGKPVDKTEWGMTPPTINAYYRASANEIAFPAGILQAPFFDFAADDAVNYGGIAAVIGHELTHGFDDKGRLYAADGNLKDWWTADDATQFSKRAELVASQFDAFTVNDTVHVNGKLTLGENLADLGGLNIAYEAFKRTPQGQSPKKTDGLTPDQRFFLSWAQVWRKNILPESAAQLILTDPHSPSMYRVNGPVANMDAWYAAFGVQPGDKMYKQPEERIVVW